MAGRSRRAQSAGRRRAARSVSQAASTPGTVTVCGPRTGMPVRVTGAGSRSRAARTRAASSAAGAAPLPLTAVTVPSGACTSAIASPPIEHMWG